ncbi:MAG: hypothetical protein D4R67_11345 [Bacteroidetes bacterium]|nr:MAG: hypothetical protein D4R67_11345 [Bacteroidota bacterium]
MTLRKLLVAVLIPLLFLNFGGYYVLKEWSRYYVKTRIREEILSGSFRTPLTVFELESPDSDPLFRRLEKFEFVYKDHLYDIVSEQQNGTKVTFVCINDQDEETLIRNYDRSSDSKLARVMVQLIIHQALIPVPVLQSPESRQPVSYPMPVFTVTARAEKPPTPPPEYL